MLLLLCIAVFVIRYWRPGDEGGKLTDATLLVVVYAVILMLAVNYPSYLQLHDIGAGIQGRYLFPVLVPFYGLACYYVQKPLPAPWLAAVAGAVGAFFVWADFPYFMTHVPGFWFVNFFN
jgi:drug/metabolite transporter (DMT)-like permease